MSSYTHLNGHVSNGGVAGIAAAPSPGFQDDSVASSSKGQSAANGHQQDGAYVDSALIRLQDQAAHNERIMSYIWKTGFECGDYSDITVHLGSSAQYRLHRIILSRSPYLVHLMTHTRYPDVYVPLEQYPDITIEAALICIAWLYSYTALDMLNVTNARATLAAACLFGGMDDLCGHAFSLCKESINVDSIPEWLAWADALQSSASASTGPSTPTSTVSPTPPPADLAAISVFGPYAQLLRDEVFEFLLVTLPQSLATEGHGPDALLPFFDRASFSTFKTAMESPKFAIGSDAERFRFVKGAIARRKDFVGAEAEETVVLAVGNGKSNVHVTRKTKRKGKPLWKVAK